MPKEKYKLHEVAKDFGLGSKDIIVLLDKYVPKERKHSTVLEDAELDLIFETLTTENEVESFDAYFAAGEKKKAEKKEEKKEEKKDDTIEVK